MHVLVARHPPNCLRHAKPIHHSFWLILIWAPCCYLQEAYPGDVIGINNPGHFAIGDTIFTGSTKIRFPGIPSFSPECFAYMRNPNPSKYKNYRKGLDQVSSQPGTLCHFVLKVYLACFFILVACSHDARPSLLLVTRDR